MIAAAEQMRMVEAHVDAALDELAVVLAKYRKEIRRRTLERVGSVGLADYGDSTWHRPSAALLLEAFDELADGAFYLVPSRARAAGDIVMVRGPEQSWRAEVRS